jgi:hypothetical protein
MPTRRRFLRTAAVGATLPLLAPTSTVEAGDPPATIDQALAAIVRLRFKHLTEAQFKTVQARLPGGVAMGEALKRVALSPLDEPCTVFVADVAE